jgi:amino acid permease
MLHTNIFDCTSTIALAIYSFAAIGMVLPMEESAKDKHNFPIVFAAGTWMMVAGLIMFGAIGYICFGDQIESIILMNLDDTMHQTVMLHALKKVIQIGFIIGALFGYPMCLWPVIQRLESMIFFKQPPTIAHSINSVVDEEAPQELTPRHSIQETGSETETDVKVITNPSSLKVNCGLEMKRNLLRIGLVFGTVILAVVVPSFDLFISIIGATFGTSLMFIVPPVMHIQVQKLLMQEPEQSRYKIKAVMIKDIILAVVGGFALLLCTSVTVRNIVLHYVKHTE